MAGNIDISKPIVDINKNAMIRQDGSDPLDEGDQIRPCVESDIRQPLKTGREAEPAYEDASEMFCRQCRRKHVVDANHRKYLRLIDHSAKLRSGVVVH